MNSFKPTNIKRSLCANANHTVAVTTWTQGTDQCYRISIDHKVVSEGSLIVNPIDEDTLS